MLLASVAIAVPLAWHAASFDDAFMYYRYAVRVRQGLGVAWNPGGPPTYGLTSNLWLLVLLPFTYLPLGVESLLRLASTAAGLVALVVMSLAVSRHATSTLLRAPVLATAAVAVPLLATASFRLNLASGMDTMLSLLANAGLVLMVLRYLETPTAASARLVGSVAFVSVLARPDSGLCALAVPFLAWFLVLGGRPRAHLIGLVAVPVILVAAEISVCGWYYGLPLPLGFYAKSARLYEGFQNNESALEYLFEASACALPFLGTLLVTIRRPQLPRLAAFLLPVAATFVYLLTVRQVMGLGGRFYLPYLPYLVVPALLGADAAMLRRPRRTILSAMASTLVLCALYVVTRPAWPALSAAYMRQVIAPSAAVPARQIAASVPLPPLKASERIVTDEIAVFLPPGASMAASEIGYLGARTPQMTLIDLAGLNDTEIGRYGLVMDSFLKRAPDLIWLPHPDYTGLWRALMTDERFWSQYELIDGAFNFGLAIRRDSPFRARIDSVVRQAWTHHYPSQRLEDYVVRR